MGDNIPDPDDLGFPADTAVVEMTPVEQAAYWKDKARKHEKKWRGLVNPHEPNRAAALPAADEAPPMFRAAMRAELKLRLPDADKETLDDLAALVKPARFLTDDGAIDTERVDRFAQKFTAPAAAEPGAAPQPHFNLGHILAGSRGPTVGLPPKGDGGISRNRARALAQFTPKQP